MSRDVALQLVIPAAFAVDLQDQHWRLSPCQTQADCPAAGDPEEHLKLITGGHYTNNATCVFGTPTKRRLLFGPTPVTPKAGVCVP